jgi:hypothetical protein
MGDHGWGQALTENQLTVFQIGMTTLCFLLAGMDPDGLTLKDALVCITTVTAATGALQAVFIPGQAVTGAMISAVFGIISTGIWLNTSPGLNRNIAGGSD